MCVCGFHVCLWTASLYIYWNEQPSLGRLRGAEACSHASIYRLPRIRARLRLPLPCAPSEVTRTETKFRRGEQGELSRAQIRGPVPPCGDMKAWNDTMCLCTCTRTHRLRFVQEKLQLGKTCHMWQVDTFLSGTSHKTGDSCLGLVWLFSHTLIVINICLTCFSLSHTEMFFPTNTV